MTKKEKFITFVYLAAIARDLSRSTADSAQIASFATRISERQIPVNPLNAAHVYLAYLDGRSKAFKWMQPADRLTCENNGTNGLGASRSEA
jgi:hypothetical protein